MTIAQGNALRLPLRDESVHCVVTSPPYWGLRDYGTATWEGGDAGCDHKLRNARNDPDRDMRHTDGRNPETNQVVATPAAIQYRDTCPKCGAVRIDDQLGLEQTPAEYVANMVEVFREVWRVLRNDGTVWLNLGDSYANSGAGGGGNRKGNEHGQHDTMKGKRPANVPGLKPKDLCMIPARVALALQADGWWLRSDVIWAKPNPMPESVTDRLTKAHEYVFLLTKRSRYFYDADAVREATTDKPVSWESRKAHGEPMRRGLKANGNYKDPHLGSHPAGRNRRTVWTIATEPYSGAHFATFPQALVEPCIKAGSSERGVCAECGSPWERVIQKPDMSQRPTRANGSKMDTDAVHLSNNWQGVPKSAGQKYQEWRNANPDVTTGFRPTCDHDADPIPATVFDPFFGSGTVGLVARRLGRRFVGVDLSFDYLQLARERLGLTALDAWNSGDGKVADDDMSGLPLFEVTT